MLVISWANVSDSFCNAYFMLPLSLHKYYAQISKSFQHYSSRSCIQLCSSLYCLLKIFGHYNKFAGFNKAQQNRSM